MNVNVSGNSGSLPLEPSFVLTTLLEAYLPGVFTTTNVNTTSVTTTYNYFQKPLFECIQELCKLSGYDFYIDCNLDVHFFEEGSVRNTTEAVVHDANILSIDDFGQDYSKIKNRIKVQGKDIGDLPLIYTTESEDSNYGVDSDYGYRELVIQDDNISSYEQAEDRAKAELEVGLNPDIQGESECLGLATIQPGEYIRISAPQSNLQPDFYKIISYTHSIKDGVFTTRLNINKENVKLSKVIKSNISDTKNISQVENPYGLLYSWNFNFADYPEGYPEGEYSLAGVEIQNGALKLIEAGTGFFISPALELSSNISGRVNLRLKGTALAGVLGYVSPDDGNTWFPVWDGSSSSGYGLIATGKKIKIGFYLTSINTQITSACLLYE